MATVVSPVFVGRRGDLEAVAAAFAQAGQGEPAVVIVGGEAGVGKTRLVEEAGAAARAAGGRVIDYRGRTIPAAGTLTLTHYYATVSGADADVEAGADRLRAWFGQTAPAPGGAGGASPVTRMPVRPQLSRGGRVRVRRSPPARAPG